MARTTAKIAPFFLGYLDPHLLHGSLSPCDVSQPPPPNRIWIGSSDFEGLTNVTDRQTQTNHATQSVV